MPPPQIASCLAAATLAAPEAEAALYGNALIGPGGVAPAWPSAVGYGVQSTVYGARPYGHLAYGYGKRSADADAYYGYGVGIHNNNVYSGFTGNHYAAGLPGRSFAAVTHGAGYHYGKRSADADAYYGYGHGLAYGYGRGYGYGLGVAHHGGHATSFVARSPQGLHYGKRSADAEADAYYGHYGYGLGYGRAYGYGHHGGYYGHGYGHGYGYGYYG